jgi:transcriptional regulator with XRE-family HTH domain
MNTFGNLLRLYRQEKKLTQSELARKCNVCRDYIIKLETGKRIAPPEETVLTIGEILLLSSQDTQQLLEAAQSERLYRASLKSSKLKVSSIVQYIANHLSQEELLTLSYQIQALATAKQ